MNFYFLSLFIVLYVIPVDAFKLTPSALVLYRLAQLSSFCSKW